MRHDVIILDGRHLLWRASDAFRDLHAQVNGVEIGTGGMYGFLNLSMRVQNRYGGTVMVCWEGSGNFRYQLFPEYKRKRTEPDHPDTRALIDDMSHQEHRLKAVLRAAGVRQYTAEGGEADDAIGVLAAQCSSRGLSTVIYTGDSDLRQLVDDTVRVAAPGRKGDVVLYDTQKVIEKHGVVPGLLPDLKALSGDTSDNIPGIRGIGPKTAAQAVSALGDVEEIIKAANVGTTWPIAERFKEPVKQGADEIRLYKQLTTIRRDLPLKLIEPKRGQALLVKHLMAYKFRSMLAPNELEGLMRLGA